MCPPIFEFACPSCQHIEEELCKSDQIVATTLCPKCNVHMPKILSNPQGYVRGSGFPCYKKN